MNIKALKSHRFPSDKQNSKWRLILSAILLLVVASLQSELLQVHRATVSAAGLTGTARRRVILMIGDGMGQFHRQAGQWSKVGLSGTLVMDSLPVSGSIVTDSADNPVTDSAAAATAMSTGFKTKNGYLGVDQNNVALTSILDLAQERGLLTGLVVTKNITDATPAAFSAHINDRSQLLEIASQIQAHGVDILLGGGEGDWIPNDYSGCFGIGHRVDGHNLITEAAGYEHVCNSTDLLALPDGYHRLIGFFAHNTMSRPYDPSLAEMTVAALNSLETDAEGFFLMVEGSQIDSASHSWEGGNMIDDVKTFDEAVQEAVIFATANPDTLLIVVADHETGGLSLDRSGAACDTPDEGPFPIFGSSDTFCTDFTTSNHTGVNVPLTAMGPDSDYLSGTHENTEIFTTMRRYLTTFEYNYLPLVKIP